MSLIIAFSACPCVCSIPHRVHFLSEAQFQRPTAEDEAMSLLGHLLVGVRTYKRQTVNRGIVERGQLIAGQLIARTHNRADT